MFVTVIDSIYFVRHPVGSGRTKRLPMRSLLQFKERACRSNKETSEQRVQRLQTQACAGQRQLNKPHRTNLSRFIQLGNTGRPQMCVSSSFVFSCSLFLLFIDYEVYVLLFAFYTPYLPPLNLPSPPPSRSPPYLRTPLWIPPRSEEPREEGAPSLPRHSRLGSLP